eukprot:CAMPEP_0170105304 /NCGR_PEP_ID=MMETSP0020_2-20130122/4680_1 /TAXON_ID=98059 /ORGANISM="Dinobryon sp., Strain UTEXLB2267" /LENGTH=59 /DNA_ID=CAMNT_0010329377 /DNA_START=1389 /DNA_END=1565 /DNA_ORIENTATION=-
MDDPSGQKLATYAFCGYPPTVTLNTSRDVEGATVGIEIVSADGTVLVVQVTVTLLQLQQ